jgi:NAD(P)-dependent dehydrogenase (short-subunit alcohol dehydrogenase family)
MIQKHGIENPDAAAGRATLMASKRASYNTGTSIQVDGGWIRSLL